MVPVVMSQTLFVDKGAGKSRDKLFISTDGTVIGRFLSRVERTKWSFQLLSPDDRFVRRALLHLPGNGSFYQSDDSGSIPIYHSKQVSQDIRYVEVIPYTGESVYSLSLFDEEEILESVVELVGGRVGKIIVEQEEGDKGESVLHIELTEMSPRLLEHHVLIALSSGKERVLIDEAVGRDVYLYGPDLFRDFHLWVYVR
jgi:hypothetical protein